MDQRERFADQLTKWQAQQRDLEQDLARAKDAEKGPICESLMKVEDHLRRLEHMLEVTG